MSFQQNHNSIAENNTTEDKMKSSALDDQRNSRKSSFSERPNRDASLLMPAKLNDAQMHYYMPQRGVSQTPSSRHSEIQPREEVRSLLDEMKKKYKIYKPETTLNDPYKLSNQHFSISEARLNQPTPLIVKDASFHDYSYLQRSTKTPAARVRYSFRDTANPFFAGRTDSGTFIHPKGPLYTEAQSHREIVKPLEEEKSVRSIGGIPFNREQFTPKDHYSNIIYGYGTPKVDSYSKDNTGSLKGSQLIEKSIDENKLHDFYLKNDTQVSKPKPNIVTAPERYTRSQSSTPKYDSKKVDDIINRIMRGQQGQANNSHISEPSLDQSKKKSIFSGSMIAKNKFHTEGSESSIKNNSRTELPKSTHLDEMEDQPYEPEMHKPKNIFSSLVTDHTNKVLSKSLPSKNVQLNTNSKSLNNAANAEKNRPELNNQALLENVNHYHALKTKNTEATVEHNKPVEDLIFYCGEMENDDDSVILSIVAQDILALNQPQKQDTVKSKHESPKKNVLTHDYSGSALKSASSHNRDVWQRTASANEEEEWQTEGENSVKQSPNHKIFEEDFSQSPKGRVSNKNIFSSTLEKKLEKSIQREINQSATKQTQGIDAYHPDIESGFESQQPIEFKTKNGDIIIENEENESSATDEYSHHNQAINNSDQVSRKLELQPNTRTRPPKTPDSKITHTEVDSSNKQQKVSRVTRKQETPKQRNMEGPSTDGAQGDVSSAADLQESDIDQAKIRSNTQLKNEDAKVISRTITAKGTTNPTFSKNRSSQKREHPNISDSNLRESGNLTAQKSTQDSSRAVAKTEIPSNGVVHRSRPQLSKR